MRKCGVLLVCDILSCSVLWNAEGALLEPKKSSPQCWVPELVSLGPKPVLSYVDGSSDFQQVFNPAWVAASSGTGGRQGLMVRTQNCSGCTCCVCSGFGHNASRLTFAELLSTDHSRDTEPRFSRVSPESVVFAPELELENLGVEDPRIVYDEVEKLYHMFYTCYHEQKKTKLRKVQVCHAYASDPTRAGSWKRQGAIFTSGTKSASVLQRGRGGGDHLMFWGEGVIKVTKSSSMHGFRRAQQQQSKVFMEKTLWGAPLVEPGPPPLRLSTGDYVFFVNTWDKHFPKPPGYQPGWLVLNGSNPLQIIAQAPEPLWSPSKAPWMTGDLPYGCNAKNVAFVSAAHETETPDTFRLYFGGADAVVGTAVVRFNKVPATACSEQTVISDETLKENQDMTRHSKWHRTSKPYLSSAAGIVGKPPRRGKTALPMMRSETNFAAEG